MAMQNNYLKIIVAIDSLESSITISVLFGIKMPFSGQASMHVYHY